MTQSQIENETIERLARLAEDPDGPDFIMGYLSKREVAEWLRTQKSEELLTQKSESVREADQYPRPARPVAAFYTKFRDEQDIHPGIALTFTQWLDFADAWSRAATLKLAEEAEQEVLTKVQYSDCRMYWRSFAAWLREKAR
jgi:hypothetical protein